MEKELSNKWSENLIIGNHAEREGWFKMEIDLCTLFFFFFSDVCSTLSVVFISMSV